MDDATLTALRPLCQMFYWKYPQCTGCPVAAKTGLPRCDGTPYDIVVEMEDDDDSYLEAAQAELDFLKSLLPND